MINGVKVKNLKVLPDERGRVMEILRRDDSFFSCFGQVYLTTAYQGVVKGWHYHKKQTDNMTVVKGMMKIVLYDNRKSSTTKGEINELFAGKHNHILIQIPPLVYHGFKCISPEEALAINVPDKLYNYKQPDEFRVDPHSQKIPYAWERKER